MLDQIEWIKNSHMATPAYIFDLESIVEKIQHTRSVLPAQVKLCYAMKANPFVIDSIVEEVDYLEVCSPGEFKICELSHVPMNKVVVSGVYKNQKDIEASIHQYGNLITYTVESLNQWELINQLAQKYQVRLRLLLRITSGNQFGMDIDDIHTYLKTVEISGVEIVGIQYFSGTMKSSTKKYRKDLAKVQEVINMLEMTYGLSHLAIEYGPGLPIDYFGDHPDLEDTMLSNLKESLEEIDPSRKITLEIGRFLVASSGYYMTSVVDTKQREGNHYCIVDGGINHINYFGQNMAMKVPPVRQLKSKGDSRQWTVFGSLCTTSDILIRNISLIDLEVGDRLLFEKAGAYAMTEGISLFLSRVLPSIYFVSKKDGIQKVRSGIDTYPLNYTERG